MTEKKYKQVCECENCGNEAEMTITCKFIPEENFAAPEQVSPADHKHEKIKGQAICSQCGSEADIWIDDIKKLEEV